jgi:hypothetical protein
VAHNSYGGRPDSMSPVALRSRISRAVVYEAAHGSCRLSVLPPEPEFSPAPAPHSFSCLAQDHGVWF